MNKNRKYRRFNGAHTDMENNHHNPDTAQDDVNAEEFAVKEGQEMAGAEATAEEVAEAEEVPSAKAEIEQLREAVEKEKKEYLFLAAEFDNFRKRTIREKSELIKNAAESVLKGLLPIVDDFERGLKASADADDASSAREGMELIYNKLVKYLAQNGVKPIDTSDGVFDSDRHDAIATVPVPDEKLKGKIIDTVEKGYMINDKVLRHSKVVVGQ